MKKIFLIFLYILIFSIFAISQLFQPPIKNSYITASFGEYRDTGANSHFHLGVDFSTFNRKGESVYATAEGSLYKIWLNDPLYGNAVFLYHESSDLISGYAHLSVFSDKITKYSQLVQNEFGNQRIEIVFPKGEIPIKLNEVIAYSGDTGEAIAPHLHFEVLKESGEELTIYDPLEFLEYQESRNKSLELIRIRSNNKYFEITENGETVVEYTGNYPRIDIRVREKIGDNSTILPKKVSMYINGNLTYKLDFSQIKESEIYQADVIFGYGSTSSIYWLKMYSDDYLSPIVINDFSAFSYNPSTTLNGEIVLEDIWGNEKVYKLKFIKP
ncbi:M23 family metallopeptidase [Petrotoga olearia]|uniref:Peptidase M23 n=2 Tax=Petrotoga olearia TaxID=156203 RepID=A0A2K1P2J1_9BACT|nr:M23 family metallopeptidase [Petrotoga olearia]KUK15463.1 MAG: Peptidase M23B [Petrotoga mobilis]PNR96937.1 hypothetical protein X929_03850 [Petrotoga olearia DSM 13574]RMA70555.1 peptidase M23-like protein [Petrotoga olearia]